MSVKRHKWVIHENGDKTCKDCESLIRANIKANFGKVKYIETNKDGTWKAVSYYPRCLFNFNKRKAASK